MTTFNAHRAEELRNRFALALTAISSVFTACSVVTLYTITVVARIPTVVVTVLVIIAILLFLKQPPTSTLHTKILWSELVRGLHSRFGQKGRSELMILN